MLEADVCVIGAGSGGLSVASGAVQLGFSVILIEKDEMGGDCLNRGCVPSKALLHMAKQGETFRQAHHHVKTSIAQIAPHDSQQRFENLGCVVIRQPVHFVDHKTLETADGRKIIARYIVIAAGSRPAIPEIKGLDEMKILTNETIFDLSVKPSHLAIIGGGPIGVEMAQAHALLGCQVSLITDGSILTKDDPDCTDVIRHQLQANNVILYENENIQSVKHGKMHEVNFNGQTVTASHILVATGRTPNVDTLRLDSAGIKYDANGIIVNKRLKTNRRNIYALGDIVKGHPYFTHAAGYQAGIIIRNICFRQRAKVDYRAFPWVTYTSPELAHVGMTNDQAVKKFGKKNIRVLAYAIAENDRAVTENMEHGLIKVIGKANGRILGVSIAAKNAGELIAPWCLAINKSLKMKDMAGLILPYPTISEIHKTIAGQWYKDRLFSASTRRIVKLLQKLPSF